ADDLQRLGLVASGLVERLLDVHHAGAGGLAQFRDVSDGVIRHKLVRSFESTGCPQAWSVVSVASTAASAAAVSGDGAGSASAATGASAASAAAASATSAWASAVSAACAASAACSLSWAARSS